MPYGSPSPAQYAQAMGWLTPQQPQLPTAAQAAALPGSGSGFTGEAVQPGYDDASDLLRRALARTFSDRFARHVVDDPYSPGSAVKTFLDPASQDARQAAFGIAQGNPGQTLAGGAGTVMNVGGGPIMGGALHMAGMIPGVKPAAKRAAKVLAQAGADVLGDVAPGVGKAVRGIINTPDLREMTTADAIQAARSEPHLMQDSTGQFIGGPRGLMSRDQLQIMRNKFDAQVEAGVSGGDWYDRAREANKLWAGDDPARQRLIAQEEALWSAQATPDTNMNFMLQGHNAWEMGDPLDKVRTGQQARTYNKARESGEDIGLGDKTGIYGKHLDPTKPFATTGTNDIWHARAFGYTNPGGEEFSRALTAQEHRFLDYETLLAVDRANAKNLGGRSDWGAHEIQAAPWVAGKGAGLARKSKGRKTLEQGIAEASLTYPDLVDKYTADPLYRQVPGTSWSAGNQPGRDRLYDAVGLYQQPTVMGSGGMVAQPLVGMQKAGGGVDSASRRAMDLVEGLRSYTDLTPQGQWSKTILNAPPGEMNALHVPMGATAMPDQLARLQEIGAPHGLGHVTGTGSGVTMAGYGPAAPSGQRLGKLLQGGLATDINQVTGGVPQRAAVERNIIPMHDPRFVEGSGQATDRVLKLWEGVPESVQGKLQDDAAIRSKAADNLRVMGKSIRADQRNALQILSQGGMRALAAARRSGKVSLPAVTAALVGAGALASQPGGQQAAGPTEY